jgi:hypothetical protein
LKRAAKQVAFSPEIAQAIAREDEPSLGSVVIDHDGPSYDTGVLDEFEDIDKPDLPRRPRGRPRKSGEAVGEREADPEVEQPPEEEPAPLPQRRIDFEV